MSLNGFAWILHPLIDFIMPCSCPHRLVTVPDANSTRALLVHWLVGHSASYAQSHRAMCFNGFVWIPYSFEVSSMHCSCPHRLVTVPDANPTRALLVPWLVGHSISHAQSHRARCFNSFAWILYSLGVSSMHCSCHHRLVTVPVANSTHALLVPWLVGHSTPPAQSHRATCFNGFAWIPYSS